MGRSWRGLACATVVLLTSCSGDLAPSIEACERILATRMPAARVTTSASDADLEAVLAFELGSWWEESRRGQIACSFDEQPAGRLRLRAATLDGQPFTTAEVTVVNADLLLADMRRSVEADGARRE